MSDRHPKSEADQVLESVKRLVAAAPQPAAKGDTRPGEKLLLTPSLRVEEANDDAPLSTAAPAPQPAALSSPATDDVGVLEDVALTAEGHSLEDRIAELEAAVSTQDDEFEPDGSELIDRETPRRFVFQHTPVDLPTIPMPGPSQSLADRFEDVDVVEAAISSDARAQPADPAPAAPQAIDQDPIPLRAETGTDETLDPPREAVADDPVAFAPVPPPADSPNADGVDVAEDLEIDEDMLRDIVAEIVRAELQGELGERITRNVRKLVRREIHRAIMTRDFS